MTGFLKATSSLGTPRPDCGVCCTQDEDGDLYKMALSVLLPHKTEY